MFKSAYLHNPDLSFYWPQLAGFTRSKKASDLNRSVAMEALQRLNHKLREHKDKMTIVLIGGGAMMLAYGIRKNTGDLDAIPIPPTKAVIDKMEQYRDEVTADMKEEEGVELPVDWINAQATPIFLEQAKHLRPGDLRPVPHLDFSNLSIMVAIPEALLATKIESLRPGTKDYRDVLMLCKLLKVRSWEQFLSIVEPRVADIGVIGNEDIQTLKQLIAKV